MSTHLTSTEPMFHQFACHDPYGDAASCDCNNLTRADACDLWDCGPHCTHPEVGAAWCEPF